jgi:hypothetical protein
MKAFINKLGIVACLLVLSLTAMSQSVHLTLNPQGTQPYTASLTDIIFVNATYSYSNAVGVVEVKISYNPSQITFVNSNSFNIIPTTTTTPTTGVPGGNITTLTYAIQSSSANNQGGDIILKFKSRCPSTCFGQNINTVINGDITHDNISFSAPAQNLGIQVLNHWASVNSHAFHSFLQSSYELTFRVVVRSVGCVDVVNPKFEIDPSIGTLISATNGLLSGNTLIPNQNSYSGSSNNPHEYYYTIKIPCSTPAGTVITSDIKLTGTNCGIDDMTVINFPQGSYTLPVSIGPSPSAALIVNGGTGYFDAKVVNNGNTPLNLIMENELPDVNITNIQTTGGNLGLTGTITYYDCNNNPTTFPLNSGGTPPSLSTKVTMTLSNLTPGSFKRFRIWYNFSNSCSGAFPQTPLVMNSSLTYNCDISGLSNVCFECGNGSPGTISAIAEYNPRPIINCDWLASNTQCLDSGDTAELCIQFHNMGLFPLNNGLVDFDLSSHLSYLPGFDSYSGFSINPTHVSGSEIQWSLPPIPPDRSDHKICFKAVVGGSPPFGALGMGYEVSGDGFRRQQRCRLAVYICAHPEYEVVKYVKGDLDANYGSSGHATPGSVASYQITVNNTGNTPIDNIVLVDRLPFVGDQTIMTCSPRGSQFSLSPSSALTIPGASVEYSPDPNAATGWPTTDPSCNSPATVFGNSFAPFAPNNLHITLDDPIPMGGSYTFTFDVQVPGDAQTDQIACNTIGIICGYLDNAGNAIPLHPLESNPVCLEIANSPAQDTTETGDTSAPDTTITPEGECCAGVLNGIGLEQSIDNNSIQINSSITAGTTELTRVNVSLVDFRVNRPEDCGVCEKNPINMGNITDPSGSVDWVNLPEGLPFGRLVEWKDSIGRNWGEPTSLDFKIPLPNQSAISCCCDTIEYCLKFSFTDKNCVTCDTILCYTIYRGEGCDSSLVPTSCECGNWENQQIGVNNERFTCGSQVELETNTTHNFLAPPFSCNGDAENCEVSYSWYVDGNFDGTGSSYSASFAPGTHTVQVKPNCGTSTCGECLLTIVVPEISCACDQWENNEVTYNGVTNGQIRCGGSAPNPLEFGTYNFTWPEFECTPSGENCAVSYSWTLSSSNGFNQNGNGSSINVNLTAPGSYTGTVTPICGTDTCAPCEFSFEIDDEDSCVCGDWTSRVLLVNDLEVDCDRQIELAGGVTHNFEAPAYECSPDNETCQVVYHWLDNGISVGVGTSYSSILDPGNHVITILPVCGEDTCDACKLEIDIEPVDSCECKAWDTEVVEYTGASSGQIRCGTAAPTTLVAGNYTFTSPEYLCDPSSENCQPQYEWTITGPSGFSESGSGSDFTVNLTLAGNYFVAISPICGTNECENICDFAFAVGDSCACGDWTSRVILVNGRRVNCDVQIELEGGVTHNFIAPNYVCSPDNETCQVEYHWFDDQTHLGSGPDYSAVLDPGNHVITILPVCGTDTCDPCKIEVFIPADDSCTCGEWETGEVGYSGETSGSIICGEQARNPLLFGSYTFTSPAYQCDADNDNCQPNYEWTISGPNGYEVTGSGSTLVLNLTQAGEYYGKVTAICGTSVCEKTCEFGFVVAESNPCECGTWGGDQVAYTGPTSGNIRCGTEAPSALFTGNYTFTSPSYECNPQSRNCQPDHEWAISGPNGYTQTGSGVSFNVTFSQPGEYKIRITTSCGSEKCEKPCEFKFKVERSTCRCKEWAARGLRVNNQSVRCGKRIKLNDDIPHTFEAPDYFCSPDTENCMPTYQWLINGNVAAVGQTYTHTFTPGLYTIEVIPLCGETPCEACKIQVLIR